MSGNYIMDPCFSDPSGTPEVACPTSTGDPSAVTLMNLTQALPDSYSDSGSSPNPWLFQLADGAYCGVITGATTTVDGMPLSGGCTDSNSWVGNVDKTSRAWTVLIQAPRSSTLTRVAIARAWQ
jgi:hypothetical protein